MGKPRVLGSKAKIVLMNGGTEISIGEIDKFGAKSLDELKKYKPLGEGDITSQTVFGGWDLSFEGGKVDWNLAMLIHGQDEKINQGKASPYFSVKQTIEYTDGKIEEWIYNNVTIHGYELDTPNEELSEKFSGFSGTKRTKGAGATNITETNKTTIQQMIDAITVG